MVNSKRAQLKIQQMIFMLLAVTLFFVLVGLIVLSVWISDLKESSVDLKEKGAQELVSALANSPEFSCGEYFGTAMVDCVDLDKIIILKQNIEEYNNFWSDVENIKIDIVYPEKNKEECTIQNYPNCNSINLFDREGGIPARNFVLACRKERLSEEMHNKCEIAEVSVVYTSSQSIEEDE